MIEAIMLDLQLLPDEGRELSHLHASTYLSMTQFINGRHCRPKLAQQIVRLLNLLLAHPELNQVPGSRDTYLLLLEHWQKISAQLLDQHDSLKQSAVYH
jgi:hypothetical protein